MSQLTQLTPRMASILQAVVEQYIATGRPVGSKLLSRAGSFGLSPSTVRSEMARLEQMGYLDHPHTSAGRMPTDRGYRFYVDQCFRGRRCRQLSQLVDLDQLGGEIEDAMRQAASLLAGATGLLALVSAPSQNNAAIKHVEVLQLHADLVMVVIITASGGVSKKLIMFDGPVDSGLVNWARGYLNDALDGLDLGSRRLRLRLGEAGLSGVEAAFLASLAPAFEAPADGGVGGLYIDGVSGFFSRLESDAAASLPYVMELLDRQDQMLLLLNSAPFEQRVFLRIGSELAVAVQSCTLVAANYGVAHRNLGTVGLLGPLRMDYETAICSVEYAARSLSRFVEEIFN